MVLFIFFNTAGVSRDQCHDKNIEETYHSNQCKFFFNQVKLLYSLEVQSTDDQPWSVDYKTLDLSVPFHGILAVQAMVAECYSGLKDCTD